MTDQIAYETLPIGMPGTWVPSERDRIDRETAYYRQIGETKQGIIEAQQATMADLMAENRLLKQMLVNHWRHTQSTGAYLIQQGQDMERSAVAMAEHLIEVGVPVDVNVFSIGQEGM